MNSAAATAEGRAALDEAANGSVREGAARAGLVAHGVIYLIVGVIALQIAFGGDGQQADRGGALAEIAEKPFGSVLLWALGAGLTGMALWRLSEAVFGCAGPDGHTTRKRLAAAGGFVVQTAAAFSALAFAAGAGSSGGGSSDSTSKDATAKVLDLPAGQWLVALAGAAVVVAGLWIAGRAVKRSYHKQLKMGELTPRTGRLVDVTGVGGGAARGLVFAAAGVFAFRAAVVYDPDEAKGLDDTLRSFADTPLGPWLLALVAAGLVLFGLFSFALARWRKV